jgi:hypothetical protein
LWGWSGLFLGLALSVKPFLAILLGYMIWRRRWRAAAACLSAVVLCFALGLAVFGWENHLSWEHRLAVSEGWAWLPMNASLTGMMTRTLAASVWYVPLANFSAPALWTVWILLATGIGLVTIALTSRGITAVQVDRDFSLLLIASILLCPLGWIYYLWLALPPLLALWAAGRSRPEQASLWTRCLLSITAVAFLWPIVFTRFFQPEGAELRVLGARSTEVFPGAAFATLVIGNIYFWGLLALWICLAWHCWARRREPARSSIPQLRHLDAADYRVSVVMPVFSETDSVRQIVDWLVRVIGPRLEEIIIVQSPRSSEASRAVCLKLAERYPQVRLQTQRNNPGLGHAVREGYEAVRGNVVLNIDSDGEMELETVTRMLDAMARGNYGLVVASRWIRGGGFSGYSSLKYYFNWCFQSLFRCLFWTRLHDLTYGFKLMLAELVHGISWEGTLHEIACETTLKPVRLGIAVAEVPSIWTARTQGASKNTFWRNFRYVRTAIAILVNGVPFAERPLPENDGPLDGSAAVDFSREDENVAEYVAS